MHKTQRIRQQTLGLPSWPRFKVKAGGQGCTISGRHLTPGRAMLARRLAVLVDVAALAWLPWQYWGLHNVPAWVAQAVNAATRQLGYQYVTFDQRRWIYAGLWVVAVLLLPVWRRLTTAALNPLLKRRSTVQLTARWLFVPRLIGRRAIDRHAVQPLTFISQPHPNLAWLGVKGGSNWLTAFHQQIRFLYLQHGHDLIEVARFTSPQDAERFLHACSYALLLRLKTTPATSAGTPFSSLIGASNVAEV